MEWALQHPGVPGLLIAFLLNCSIPVLSVAQHQRWRSPCLTEQKAFLLPCHLAITLNSWKKVRVKIKCIEEVQI